MAAILLVDDEPAIRESLAFALRRDGFEVAEAATLREARPRAAEADLVILDLVLPDGNGLDFLRTLRARSDVPVIVLTSRDEETDRVVGLEIGADDYVLKPFSPREVAARVRAVLRRAAKPAPQPEETAVRVGNALARRAHAEGRGAGPGAGALPDRVQPARRCFFAARGASSSAARILDSVWGSDVVVGDRTVDVHVKALRRKLEEAGGDPRVLETVRGVGYRLRDG